MTPHPNCTPGVLDDRDPAGVSLAAHALNQLPRAVVIVDSMTRLHFANEAARALLHPAALVPAQPSPFAAVLGAADALPVDVRTRILACCAGFCEPGADARQDVLLPLGAGHTLAIHVRRLDTDRWMILLDDRRTAAGPEIPDALRDPVTDLGNRDYLDQRLDAELADADPDASPALLICRADAFETIQAKLGRPGADALERAIAGRLRGATREMDVLARLEAGRFAILMPNGDALEILARRVVETLSMSYRIHNKLISLAISLGAARAPEDGTQGPRLLQNAGCACDAAQASGGRALGRFNQTIAAHRPARPVPLPAPLVVPLPGPLPGPSPLRDRTIDE